MTQRVWFLMLIGAVVSIRVICGLFVGVVPDEAYYWDWSRMLAWGYFDHPPMVAAWCKVATLAPLPPWIALRIVPFVGSLFVLWAGVALAHYYVKRTSSRIALVLIYSLTLLFGLGGLLLTPDIPLLVFWSAGLVLVYRAVFSRSVYSWLLLGPVMGCGLLSKYTFVLFYLCLGIFLLCTREGRFALRSPFVYVALVLSGLVFLPHLLWSSQHQWVSILFQLGHGLGVKSRLHFDLLGDYVGAQVGVITPFLFVVLCMALGAGVRTLRTQSRLVFLVVYTVVPLIVFAVSSLSKRVEANWPAAAYIAGFALIAWYWERVVDRGFRVRRMYILASILSAVCITLVVLFHAVIPVLPIPGPADQTGQTRGWRPFCNQIDSLRRQIDPQLLLPICGSRYQETACMALYLPDHPRVWALAMGTRPNQYTFVQPVDSLIGRQVLCLTSWPDSVLIANYAGVFDSIVVAGHPVRVVPRNGSQVFTLFKGRYIRVQRPI